MTLGFVAGALLAGLALAALPLVIHLISKRRARNVRFAAIEFVLRSKRRTARSLRLRQLLLLLLRTLLVAAVALAVAGPLLEEPEEDATRTEAPLVIALVLDESASMHASLDGQSAFRRAQAAAVDTVREAKEDVRFALVACGDRPRDVVAEPTFERGAVLSALERLQPGYGRSDLVACVGRASDLAARVQGEGERRVVVLSDLAQHAFQGAAAGAGKGVVVEWVPAFDEEPPPNHGLSAVSIERTAATQGDAIEVSFTLSRYGGLEASVPVDLFLGGARTARITVPLANGASEQRSFTHDFTASGGRPEGDPADWEARVLAGDDALAVDNEAVLPVTLSPPVRVLLVDGAPQPVPFRDEVFYLESALKQPKQSRAPMAVEVVGSDEVNAGRLADARVVVLANVARLDDAAARALVEFVRAGGGLFVTSGDQLDVEWYNRALAELLPGALRGAKGQALLDDASVAEVLGLSRFAEGHPIFRGLADDDEAGGLVGLSRVRTHTTMLLEPDAKGERSLLMRFTNEAPALAERQVEAGRVMLLATTVDRDWSDLAIRPGFLPLMQQIVLHLAGALDETGARVLTVGEPRTLSLPKGAELLEVRAPGGEATRLVADDAADAHADGSRPVVFEATTTPGLYRVLVRFPGGELRELAAERFTALVHPAESDLRRASPEALANALPRGAAQRGGAASDEDVPLWPWLLVGCFVLLLLESLVLRRAAVSLRGG